MSGNSHILHFKAFTLTNLKGGAISLAIGGILYLVVIRGLLKISGHYADYWPKWLDLENLVYRGIPARFIFALWCTVLRIVEMSTDTIIVLIRKTFMRETRVRNSSHRFGLAGVMAAEFSEAVKPIVTNFTFALLMTCLGIVVMLFAIFYFAVLV
jgi:hydrogenase-4 component B